MKKLLLLLAVLSILALVLVPLAAQVPSRPTYIAKDTIEDPGTTVTELSILYFSGEWDTLQTKVGELLKSRKIKDHPIDAKKNYYFVIILSQEADEGPGLIRFLWHDPQPEPYVAWLPGLKQVFEIVLSEKDEITLKTSYLSTEVENPLLAQVPKFVKLLEPFMALFGAEETKTIPSIAIELRQVSLPHKRAKLSIVDSANLSDRPLSRKISEASEKLSESLRIRDAYKNAYGQELAGAICSRLKKETEPGKGSARPLFRMRKAVGEVYKSYIERHAPKPEELKLAMDIEEKFLGLIAGTAEKDVEAETEYSNIPLAQCSFGLVSALPIRNDFSRNRVKVADIGVYANHPLKGPLMAAIVNYHPVKYNPQSPHLQAGERYRLFVGGVLSPELGVCAGVGVAILRGLSLNAGIAYLGIPVKNDPAIVLIDGLTYEKPADPIHPFKTKWGNVFFVGFGYSFE